VFLSIDICCHTFNTIDLDVKTPTVLFTDTQDRAPLISPTSEGTNEMIENPIQPTTVTSAIRISPSISSFTSLSEPPAQIRYSV
jgi:AmiR/NasT family two-component response regulator